MNNARIFTVSEINESIRGILEVQLPFVSVAGEISNLRQPLSGHCYFTLKDDRSQIRAVLFKMQQRYLESEPADGQMVICRGRISVYEPRGEYQLIIDTMDFHGTGIMQLEFEKLKQKLSEEGLFAREAKKPLPSFPEHVTVVTSPKGAAVHDFIRIARKRCPQVKIAVYPVPVQGDAAPGEIVAAIRNINRQVDTDIIVLCRGGGSIEDLWAFNKESVARAIYDSTIPVVSAIGHEIDFTIADFTSDLRAPTPSAAAEMILPDARELRALIRQLQLRQTRIISSLLEQLQARIATSGTRLAALRHPLDHLSMKLDHAASDFQRAFTLRIQAKQHELEQAAQRIYRFDPVCYLDRLALKINELRRKLLLAVNRDVEKRGTNLRKAADLLEAVSPLATLARGYAIARKGSSTGRVVTDARQVKTGELINVTLHMGSLDCRIEKTGESRLPGEKKSVGGQD